MNIAFRVDASVEIGTGHVMRCITLAEMLRQKGSTIFFLCKKYEGNLISFLKQKGFVTIALSDNPFNQQEDANETIEKIASLQIDTIIVDHYGIDVTWERFLRPYAKNICVIDDLANRQHDCDILLDQNFYPNMEEKYRYLIPESCRLYLGPKYLLLRPEFYQISHRKRNEVRNLLIFFGGSDPTNETMKALEALENLQLKNIELNVVVGESNLNKEKIEWVVKKIGGKFHCQIDYLAKLMDEADLSLGAGGVTMWERCFVGLPSIVTIVAENQRGSTEAAYRFGAVKLVGWHENVNVLTYEKELSNLINNKDILHTLQQKGYELLGKNEKQDFKDHPVVEAIYSK